MIKANFNAYASYVTDSLYQWDINQTLSVTGLNLAVAPEVHFSNASMDKAIVIQSTKRNNVVYVDIPNSLLQQPLKIKAHIGIYEGGTFKVVEQIEIPVKAKARPVDYQIEDNDTELYSFKALENALANRVKVSDFDASNSAITARVDNIIAHNNTTTDNSELIDMRTDINGTVHGSAGTAVRKQFATIDEHINRIQNGDKYCDISEINQQYYKLSKALYKKSRYLISINSETAYVCSDIQIGTESAIGYMIDSLGDNVQLSPNKAASFYYEPSVDGLSVLRVANPNGYEISVEVCRAVNAADIYGVNDAVSGITPQMFGAVGDGVTDDTEAINKAIEYAYENGIRNVIIPKSSDCYIITKIVLKDNVNLIGNGGAFKVANNYAIDNAIDYYVIYADADNISIENLIVYGNSENNIAFNVCDTITVLGDNVSVKNCKLYDAIDSAIMFSRCSHSICSGNYINGARDLGIYINDGDGGKSCIDNVISKNIIDNCANGGIALKRSCQRNIVSENVISNTSITNASGISLVHASSETDFSYNNSIVNNRLYAVDIGIYMENTDHNIVSGNRIEFYKEKGIVITGVCSDNSIIGNLITQRTDAELPTGDYNGGIIFLNNNGGKTAKNIISGNIITTRHNPALSCYTTYAADTVIDENIISGNVFASENSFAIYAYDALRNNLVNSNIFKSNKEAYIGGENTLTNNMGA